MNDETKQDQQQQQGAAQEVGGAESGESSGSTTAVSALTDGATSLPASDASSYTPAQSGAATSSAAEILPPDAGAFNQPASVLCSQPAATDVPAADYANGLKCSWMGKNTSGMSRDELIAFIGMLDDYATRLANAAQGVGTDSQTEQLTAAHPIHTVLAELESEIERPGAILKARVKSLINDARALF